MRESDAVMGDESVCADAGGAWEDESLLRSSIICAKGKGGGKGESRGRGMSR